MKKTLLLLAAMLIISLPANTQSDELDNLLPQKINTKRTEIEDGIRDCPLITTLSHTKSALQEKDTLPPLPIFEIDCFGGVHNATVVDRPFDSTRCGIAIIYFNSNKSYNYRYTYKEFTPPGDTTRKTWSVWVSDLSNDARAVITFSDSCGNDTTITLDFYAYKVKIEPNSANFGNLDSGETKTLDFMFINKSTVEKEIGYIKLHKKTPGFDFLNENLNPLALPLFLNVGDTILFKIRFNAIEKGTIKDTIHVSDTLDCLWSNYLILEATVGEPTGVKELIYVQSVLSRFDLELPSPNPVSGTHIELKFSIDREGLTFIKIYNTNSELVLTPLSKILQEGNYALNIDVSQFSSGVYFFEMVSGEFRKAVKMVITR